MSESLITDEMTGKARRAFRAATPSSIILQGVDPMRAALEAVAPLIAAAALRDAAQVWGEGEWLEAFSALPVEDDLSAVQANVQWLRDRADTYEKETS